MVDSRCLLTFRAYSQCIIAQLSSMELFPSNRIIHQSKIIENANVHCEGAFRNSCVKYKEFIITLLLHFLLHLHLCHLPSHFFGFFLPLLFSLQLLLLRNNFSLFLGCYGNESFDYFLFRQGPVALMGS